VSAAVPDYDRENEGVIRAYGACRNEHEGTVVLTSRLGHVAKCPIVSPYSGCGRPSTHWRGLLGYLLERGGEVYVVEIVSAPDPPRTLDESCMSMLERACEMHLRAGEHLCEESERW